MQPTARLPQGLRVYAVGDIHGRIDLLRRLDAIMQDHAKRHPAERAIQVFLGDYIDRGPASREVIEWLRAEPPKDIERICLLGNHEAMCLEFLRDPREFSRWRWNGGRETMLSYGIDPDQLELAGALRFLRNEFLHHIGARHHSFLEHLSYSLSLGDYFFAHAGVRPGIPFDKQTHEDLVWIREPFLDNTNWLGKCVVHGHSPMTDPEDLPYRINVDTGAVYTGRLTCVVLEGSDRTFLSTKDGEET